MNMLSLGRVSVDSSKLSEVCRKWGIASVALFGSVLRDDFTPESDIDLLIEYFPGVRRTLFDYAPMHDDFAALFGGPVDLVQAEGLRSSRNYIRREQIFATAMPFYVSNP